MQREHGGGRVDAGAGGEVADLGFDRGEGDAGETVAEDSLQAGEFGAVVIVSGNIIGKTLTAPVLIFQLASQFQPNQAAAVATLLFAISFVLVLVTERLIGGRRSSG